MMTRGMERIEAPPAASAVELTRWLAVGSLLALIFLALAWELWLAPSRLAIKALPLCLPLPGLLKRRLHTYRWVSLGVWIYFTEGVLRTKDAAPSSQLAWVEIGLCVLLFAACVAHVRLRLRNHHGNTD
jgi:uncharacterized membrane protein